MNLSLSSTVTLNNGVTMPRLGLGVYQIPPGEKTRWAVSAALRAGYRHIDTAAVYGNETDVGAALRESGIPRNEIFVTTKLGTRDMGFESALRACDRSLKQLGLEQINLYLIHWPGSPLRGESWLALEKLYAEKKCRAIGVSNYLQSHLEEMARSFEQVPAVNQVEFSPFLYQQELMSFCREKKIQLEAYAPLTQGRRLNHSVVKRIAEQHAKTPAQILLRWALQQGLVVIPKSSHSDRIVENARLFDFQLRPEDMKSLGDLNENLRTCWDPTALP